ncbi:hypothetical protein ABZP36_033033 [Zizania latifolia]
MASSNPSASTAGDDLLDQLLDSALDDFTSLDLSAVPKSSGEASASSSASGDARPVKGLGLGLGLPDPNAPRRRTAKQPPAAPPRAAYASEALEKLTRETREAVRGLETATGAMAGLDDDAMMEEFVKQFEEFAGAQDMESIVETMMQQLLSKEILYEPMKDIVEKYPKWLEDNKSKISKEEYKRYQNQLELMMKLNNVYENEPENMTKIFEIMQNMQECGQPPSDLVQEIAPDLDLSKLGQLRVNGGDGQTSPSAMQQPSVNLAPNTRHPPHPLARAGARSASAWSRSSCLAVHLGHSHPRNSGALVHAAPNSRSHEAISTKTNTNQDAKLRVDKFYELEMSVRDCELDKYGVVNNVVYARYIEQAREELATSLGVSTSSIACTGNAMALSELNLKYFTPLKRGDKFVVKVRIAQIRGARIYVEHFIEMLPDRKLVLEATATVACLNREYRPTRVFPDLSSKLLHFFSSLDG